MAVDADTKKYLEEVKKGKPRKFVMICKGVKILSMVVYKKGSVEKYKKQAKQEGTGQFYHGVVDGKGQNISFKMLTSDGYDKPPGKALILKDFLKSQAGMQFKPDYEIVDVLPGVNEADELEPTSDQAPTEGGSETPANAASPEKDPAERAKKLAEALKKIKPLIDRVVTADPNRKGEVQAAIVQIVGQIKAQELDQAKQNLVEFVTLLKSLAAQQPVASPVDSDNRASEFANRRTVLEPRLLEAQQASAEKASKLQAVWKYAEDQANASNFDSALTAIGKLETAIEGILSESTAAVKDSTPQAKKTGEEMARESYAKAQAEGIIDRGFELDAKTVAQLTKLTMESAEYQKFAAGFTKFVSDCSLGTDAQKIPVTIWAKLIDGLAKSGYIKGAIKHVEGDPRQFILAEINNEGGKLIRDELLAQAMAGLQPFVDHAAIYLDKVIQKAAQGSTWAFWSGIGAKDAAKKESHGGIVLEGTIGAWFDEVWDFKALTSQAESLALWASLSELYAKKAAEYFDKFKFIGFVGPGATRDQSVFNKIEQPTFVEVLNTKAQVQPPKIEWYLVDCEKTDDRWVWTQNSSIAMGNDRSVVLAEVAKRYDNAEDIAPPSPGTAETDSPEPTSETEQTTGPANKLESALSAWKSAQSSMQSVLKAVEKEIGTTDHPEATKALLELKAVRSQLGGNPDTPQKVMEMRKYLEQDDVVQDVCDLTEDIRSPLIAAAVQIQSAL